MAYQLDYQMTKAKDTRLDTLWSYPDIHVVSFGRVGFNMHPTHITFERAGETVRHLSLITEDCVWLIVRTRSQILSSLLKAQLNITEAHTSVFKIVQDAGEIKEMDRRNCARRLKKGSKFRNSSQSKEKKRQPFKNQTRVLSNRFHQIYLVIFNIICFSWSQRSCAISTRPSIHFAANWFAAVGDEIGAAPIVASTQTIWLPIALIAQKVCGDWRLAFNPFISLQKSFHFSRFWDSNLGPLAPKPCTYASRDMILRTAVGQSDTISVERPHLHRGESKGCVWPLPQGRGGREGWIDWWVIAFHCSKLVLKCGLYDSK